MGKEASQKGGVQQDGNRKDHPKIALGMRVD